MNRTESKGDMANLLNFNSSRDLGFSSARNLEFNLNRELTFDVERDLMFDPNRGLGFGKRGVLFRGYVCPNCEAIVSPDATSCSECGTRFERAKAIGVMEAPPIVPSPLERASSRTSAPEPREPPIPAAAPVYPPTPAPRSLSPPRPLVPPSPMKASAPPASASRFCPNCGARSWEGDAFCWNCGARFTGPVTPAATSVSGPVAETIQLPPKKARKVVRDWQETGKTWEEYSQEK